MAIDIVGRYTTGKEKLARDIIADGDLAPQFHITATPVPGTARERSRNPEDVGKRIQCHDVFNTRRGSRVEAASIDNRQLQVMLGS